MKRSCGSHGPDLFFVMYGFKKITLTQNSPTHDVRTESRMKIRPALEK